MEAELILFIVYMAVLGAGIGTFTGLVPGIHVNTLAAIILASYPVLETILTPIVPAGSVAICLSSCIVSAAVVHSFVDYVPSVFIGAPDPDDTISMLPGHRLLSQGRGMAAVRAAAIGSCIGTCTMILLAIPLQFILYSGFGDYLDSITAIVLVITVLIMILHEDGIRRMAWSAAIIMLSGLLGLAAMDLDIPSTGLIGEGTLLFPLLSGLFGMPAMIQSLKNTNIVEQTDLEKHPVGLIPCLKGIVTGCITGWFPGITATTGAVLSSTIMPEKRPEGFIAMVASIGSAAAVMMIVTLSVSGHGRSGTMLVVSEILGDSCVGPMNENFLLLLFASAIAAAIGYHMTIGCGKMMSSLVSKIDSGRLNLVCIILITVLVALMTGPYGLLFLFVSTLAGFLPIIAGVGRIHLTGCLIIPTLLTYINSRDLVLSILC